MTQQHQHEASNQGAKPCIYEDMTKLDSNTVSELFDQFDKATSGSRRREIAGAICEELSRFVMVEKDILFAALLQAAEHGRPLPR